MSPTGHLAVGFAVKHWKSKIPLIWYLIGSYTIDFIYLILMLIGIESFGNDPWSHSLVMAIVFSSIAVAITWLFTKHLKSAVLMGVVVISHWILDFIVWNNLPFAFENNPSLGLGLYKIIGFDITAPTFNMAMVTATGIELGLLIIGLFLYFNSKQTNTTIKVV